MSGFWQDTEMVPLLDRDLEKKEKEHRHRDREERRRVERNNRDAFKELINIYKDDSKIVPKMRWKVQGQRPYSSSLLNVFLQTHI